jgi:myosin V
VRTPDGYAWTTTSQNFPRVTRFNEPIQFDHSIPLSSVVFRVKSAILATIPGTILSETTMRVTTVTSTPPPAHSPFHRSQSLPAAPPSSFSDAATRVWVRQSAVDAVLQPNKHVFRKVLIHGASADVLLPPRTTPLKSWTGSSTTSTQATVDLTLDGSSEDTVISSSGNNVPSTAVGRVMPWAWKEGILVSSNYVHEMTIQFPAESNTAAPITIQLPHSALEVGDVVLANEEEEHGAPHDLISLTHLHEPAVCLALQQRYRQNLIYTNTGPVLLALNPFATIPGLYGDVMQRKYVEAAEQQATSAATPLPPHVYAIADAAFRSMMRALDDAAGRKPEAEAHVVHQSILISGESGSGKTVTTKLVMKYLATLSQRSVQLQESAKERAYQKVQEARRIPWRKTTDGASAAAVTTSTTPSSNTIEAQVLQSNPILESFGNARTVRNDNSSRFGKFIEIQFTASGKLVGAILQTYLLEKVRLNYQNEGERNYHVFYELLSGHLSARALSQFFLAPTAHAEDFKLTNASGTFTRRDGVSDRTTCAELYTAFTTMQFSPQDVQDIFSIVAAVLHASNLTFEERNNDTCCFDESNVHFYPVCTLLGLTLTDLNQAICHCQLTAGDLAVTRSLNAAQAATGLESLLKETYGALFQYLVQRINAQMAIRSDDTNTAATIGVLDIFGFESFAVNSFEQLCINYCNEALQQQFNAYVLQNEQAEYEREGIQWSFIEFPENQDVLDLMEKRGASILSILDDQCRAPGPSDKAFCLAVYSQCSGKPRLEVTRKQQAMLQFSIHHYAGPVEYTVTGFTAKNKDELPKETVLLLSSSSMPLVRELASLMHGGREESISPDPTLTNSSNPRRLHRADSAMARPTVGGQFRSQLRTLRLKIDRTAPHYIRCLKPNDLLVPDHFDIAIVAEQLKCGGILEAVRVARAGFTQHYTHADFCRRYRALAWKEMAASHASQSAAKVSSPNPPRWNVVTPTRKPLSNRHSFPMANFVPRTSTTPTGGFNRNQSPAQVVELSPADAKALCKDLLKVLYRKIEAHGGISLENVGAAVVSSAEVLDTPSPMAKAKSYSYKSPSFTPPAWAAKSGSFPSTPKNDAGDGSVMNRNATPKPSNGGWKPRGSSSSLISGADLARVGIQMGKTKVFLRHKAFEVLERIRSKEQCSAATKLNSIFRRYLARIAYIPYRDACRQARERRRFEKLSLRDLDEFKEMKEEEFNDYISEQDMHIHGTINSSFQTVRSSFYNGSHHDASYSLSDRWTELQIREAIHNPVPRHEWGKQAPLDEAKFKWVIRDGLWVKNYD